MRRVHASFILHFYLTFIFTFLQIIVALNEEKVSCNVGFNFITEKVPIKFNVTEVPVYYGCFPEDIEKGDRTWPGEPTNLKYSLTSKQDFTLSWQPPDDSSAHHVTGFLLKLYVEDFSYTSSMDPDACYMVNLFKSQHQTTLEEGPVLQDAVIKVQCHVTSETTMSVRLFLTTLPLPSPPRPFQEIQRVIFFNGTNEWNSPVEMTSLPDIEVKHPIKSSSNYQQNSNINIMILSIMVTVMSIIIIIATLYTGYRCMLQQSSRNHSNASLGRKPSSRDYIRNNESLNNNHFIEEENSSTNLQKDSQIDYDVPKFMHSGHMIKDDDHMTNNRNLVIKDNDHVTSHCDLVIKENDHVTKYCDHVSKDDDHETNHRNLVIQENDHVTKYCDHVIKDDNHMTSHHNLVIKDNDHVTKYCHRVTKNSEYYGELCDCVKHDQESKHDDYVFRDSGVPITDDCFQSYQLHTNNNGGLPDKYRDIFMKINSES